MVNINFTYKGYEFKSIEECDVENLARWIRENNKEDDTCYSLDSQIFYRRFLEYYVTKNECFIKIENNNEIVGVFKGRLELEDRCELFIWLYIVNKELRMKGLGSEFIEKIIEYFESRYSVNVIKVGIVENNKSALAFWRGRGFNLLRMSKNFFHNSLEEERDLIILKR